VTHRRQLLVAAGAAALATGCAQHSPGNPASMSTGTPRGALSPAATTAPSTGDALWPLEPAPSARSTAADVAQDYLRHVGGWSWGRLVEQHGQAGVLVEVFGAGMSCSLAVDGGGSDAFQVVSARCGVPPLGFSRRSGILHLDVLSTAPSARLEVRANGRAFVRDLRRGSQDVKLPAPFDSAAGTITVVYRARNGRLAGLAATQIRAGDDAAG
jgi:hypothetical protein